MKIRRKKRFNIDLINSLLIIILIVTNVYIYFLAEKSESTKTTAKNININKNNYIIVKCNNEDIKCEKIKILEDYDQDEKWLLILENVNSKIYNNPKELCIEINRKNIIEISPYNKK